jgi:hypothetical protein
VSFDIVPHPNADQDSVSIEGDEFHAALRFDSTRAAGRLGHDCSRRPETVIIRLLRADREVGVISLDVEQHFVRDERGEYRLRAIVEVGEREPDRP